MQKLPAANRRRSQQKTNIWQTWEPESKKDNQLRIGESFVLQTHESNISEQEAKQKSEPKMVKLTVQKHFGQKLKQTIHKKKWTKHFWKREFRLNKKQYLKENMQKHTRKLTKIKCYKVRENEAQITGESFVLPMLPTKEEDKHYLKQRRCTSSHHDIKI